MHQIKREAFRMKECLLLGKFQDLYSLLRESWESKQRMASRITNERIDLLYATALNAGAYCAKISGAGGGGFIMVFTDPIHKDRVINALTDSCTSGLAYRCHFTGVGVQAWRVP
jgi:D-glycero-alpha-D-manno-heptose-7-phosphate kinase